MLRFKRGPIRVIETFLRSAPLIAGLQSETQVLDIKMSDHIEGLEPTACLKVILEQRAEFQSVAGIPQIYAGSLVLQSEIPQLRRFVWYWRRTIFVWTSIISFLTELVFILAFFRPITVPRGRPKIGLKSLSPKHHLLAQKQLSVSMEDYEDYNGNASMNKRPLNSV
ncbi:hypothetical protein PRUPE_4G158200 [Prunus persica]|uniref:Seipin n=1 Tax=Prunus persica TaxID=3760 RepID=A0A251PLA4_PRUPE|nr:hypothetical protein PRUPE_4G158200 [Prunus persica]